MRRSIVLKSMHVAWLDKEVKRTEISLAGIIRRLIEKEIEKDGQEADQGKGSR